MISAEWPHFFKGSFERKKKSEMRGKQNINECKTMPYFAVSVHGKR
jgi:hypothetical protein